MIKKLNMEIGEPETEVDNLTEDNKGWANKLE